MGRSPQDATAILEQHGLRGNESGRGPSWGYRSGTVSRQDPPPNAPIPDNRVVSYSLAQGIPAQVIIELFAIGVVAFIVDRLRRRRKKNDRPRPPKVEVVPVKDKDYYGEQHVEPSPLVLTVELCPVLDPGDQELDKIGSLVEQRGG